MTPGKAEWIEVIGFKGCIIIWRIQRMCLCSLPTHFVPAWRHHVELGGGGQWSCSPLPVLVSPVGISVLPKASGLGDYCMYQMKRCPWTSCASPHPTSWLSLITIAPGWPHAVHRHVWTRKMYFTHFRARRIFFPNETAGRLIFRLFMPISVASAPGCLALTLLSTLL